MAYAGLPCIQSLKHFKHLNIRSLWTLSIFQKSDYIKKHYVKNYKNITILKVICNGCVLQVEIVSPWNRSVIREGIVIESIKGCPDKNNALVTRACAPENG